MFIVSWLRKKSSVDVNVYLYVRLMYLNVIQNIDKNITMVISSGRSTYMN